MLKMLPGTRVRQVAGSLALCAFTVAAQADPISLTGACRLTSTLPGQGRCELSISASEDFLNPTPGTVRLGQIKVDGNVVLQFVNDGQNPVELGAVNYVSTSTEVTCGVSHTVSAYIAPLGVPLGTITAYAKKGSLPAVKCPDAP